MSNIKTGEPEWEPQGWQYIPEDVTAVEMEASVTAGRESRGPVYYGSTSFFLSRELCNWFTISPCFHALSSQRGLELL